MALLSEREYEKRISTSFYQFAIAGIPVWLNVTWGKINKGTMTPKLCQAAHICAAHN